jgi:hypothetical protein
MAYDLGLVETLFEGVKVLSFAKTSDVLEVELAPGVFLCFVNAKDDNESLIGFKGTPWHFHGDICFADNHGNAVEMSYGDIILGLAEGKVLICERLVNGAVIDRHLTHADFADEFRFMESGEELRVKRLEKRA